MYEHIILLTVVAHLANTETTPNLGDIRLNHYVVEENGSVIGEPQIYCTDGSRSTTWSYICAAKSTRTEGHIICKQLGYREAAYVSHRLVNGSDNTFITDVSCKQNYSHIFHCEHNIKNNSIPCGGEHFNQVMIVKCGLKSQPDSPYPGEVTLCPSDYQALQQYPVQSVSTGIVSLFFHNQWGALSHDRTGPLVDQITNYRGNLICQQMGFQKVVPGSVKTLEAYEESGYEFTSCTKPEKHSGYNGIYLESSWLFTSQLTCNPRRFTDLTCTTTDTDPCFGCCYRQPQKYFEGPTASMIVLQCMYDSFTVKEDQVPLGTKEKCAYDSRTNGGNNIIRYRSVCAAGSTAAESALAWSIASPFIIVAAIIATIVIMYCVIKKFCRNHIFPTRTAVVSTQIDDSTKQAQVYVKFCHS